MTDVKRALCILHSNTNKVKGHIRFTQKKNKPVKVDYDIRGLSTGDHGFHVHQYGNVSNKCLNAGGHFNPFKTSHGSRKNTHSHVGDLGNIYSKNRHAKGSFYDDKLSLDTKNIRSIIGRSMVVHEKVDDLGKGCDAESLKSGNAGKRLACGVIGIDNSKMVQKGGSNSCCNKSISMKKCTRKDGKKFAFPRRFSRNRCIKGPIRGFTMRSSCAPYKYCHAGGNKKTMKLLPKLKPVTDLNKRYLYKLNYPHKKRVLALDEGIQSEIKKMGKTKKLAAISKKGRLNILRIYRRKKNIKDCNKITRNMRYINKKYNLGSTKNICGK